MKLIVDFVLRFLYFLDIFESFIFFLNFFGVVSELKKVLEKFVFCVFMYCNKGNVLLLIFVGRRDFCYIVLFGSYSNY